MRSIRYLILVLTTRCNLRCRYCYNGNINLQSDMSENVLDRALDLVSEGEGHLHIQVTGGEPTLVPDLVNMVLVKAKKKIRRPYSIGIQTNGTLLDAELVVKLKAFNVQVGVSIDGPPAVHEIMRSNARATFRSLALLESFGMPFRVTTVVTRENVLFLDKLIYALAGFESFRGIGLDLLVRKGRPLSSEAIGLPDPDVLQESIRSILRSWELVNRRRSLPITIRELERLRESSYPLSLRNFCHAAEGRSIAVLPDGSLFPCGQTAGDERFLIGDVWNYDDRKLNALGSLRLSTDLCASCSLKEVCPGDCPSRIFYNGDDAKLMCVIYRTMWEFLLDRKRGASLA